MIINSRFIFFSISVRNRVSQGLRCRNKDFLGFKMQNHFRSLVDQDLVLLEQVTLLTQSYHLNQTRMKILLRSNSQQVDFFPQIEKN